ncbi:hypothetical protein C7S18_06435 [Ahniella affigens]|uniref:Uncharacterized protein n=1 Tax=Ahniella affigens TaxID=2021234 RepID=A0A2P1PPT8_9GAMM|nr:hypothetical protein C7S18_06435 [Ahniella affigens]
MDDFDKIWFHSQVVTDPPEHSINILADIKDQQTLIIDLNHRISAADAMSNDTSGRFRQLLEPRRQPGNSDLGADAYHEVKPLSDRRFLNAIAPAPVPPFSVDSDWRFERLPDSQHGYSSQSID